MTLDRYGAFEGRLISFKANSSDEVIEIIDNPLVEAVGVRCFVSSLVSAWGGLP